MLLNYALVRPRFSLSVFLDFYLPEQELTSAKIQVAERRSRKINSWQSGAPVRCTLL